MYQRGNSEFSPHSDSNFYVVVSGRVRLGSRLQQQEQHQEQYQEQEKQEGPVWKEGGRGRDTSSLTSPLRGKALPRGYARQVMGSQGCGLHRTKLYFPCPVFS